MRLLGEVLHVTKGGLIILKSLTKKPEQILNAIVVDRSMNKIGVIIDVIGPVESPFIVVKPSSAEVIKLIEGLGKPILYYIRKTRRRAR